MPVPGYECVAHNEVRDAFLIRGASATQTKSFLYNSVARLSRLKCQRFYKNILAGGKNGFIKPVPYGWYLEPKLSNY